jgi:hypothetical protein
MGCGWERKPGTKMVLYTGYEVVGKYFLADADETGRNRIGGEAAIGFWLAKREYKDTMG